MKDLKLIAGTFIDFELPGNYQFLPKYFRTGIEKQFLHYYYCFDELDHFTDHTGYYCQVRWLKLLKKRLDSLTSDFDEAKKNMDFETLGVIQAGKWEEK